MIDFFTYTYNTVTAGAKLVHTSLETGRKMPLIDPVYPLMLINPIENSQYERTMDSTSSENHVNAGIEIEIYSNLTANAEEECESIASTADGIMRGIGYVRNFDQFVTTADPTQTRLITRYRAVVSSAGYVYRK